MIAEKNLTVEDFENGCLVFQGGVANRQGGEYPDVYEGSVDEVVAATSSTPQIPRTPNQGR